MCAPQLSSVFLRTGHWSALRDKGYGQSKMAQNFVLPSSVLAGVFSSEKRGRLERKLYGVNGDYPVGDPELSPGWTLRRRNLGTPRRLILAVTEKCCKRVLTPAQPSFEGRRRSSQSDSA